MSSHHIVRDDQEPALIIANGQACSQALLDQLLEWSPWVVVLDSALHRVLALGIKIDLIIGDFDRGFDPVAYPELPQPVQIVHAPDQDKTDLEKAYEWLIAHGHRAANVVWATGRRADHHWNNMSSMLRYRDQLQVVLHDDHSTLYLLPPVFEKWYPKDTPISLVPLGRVDGITTDNLVYPLHNETLEIGVRSGTSNAVAADGRVRISHRKGHLMLMECRD